MHFFVGQTASIRDIYIINISFSCLNSLVSASRVLNSVIRNTVKKLNLVYTRFYVNYCLNCQSSQLSILIRVCVTIMVILYQLAFFLY